MNHTKHRKEGKTMKAMNTMMYVSNLIEDLTEYRAKIECAESYDDAKRYGSRMLGFIDGAHTVLNTMICMENNDFTAEMDDVLTRWEARVCEVMAKKANEFNAGHNVVMNFLKERDELLATIR